MRIRAVVVRWGLLLSGFGLPSRADACVTSALVLHEIDINLAATDTEPPSVPGDVTAEVVRRLGTHCTSDGCAESSCGDTAHVEVLFTLSTDDQSGPAAIGYQLAAADGKVLPDALKIGATPALSTEIQNTGRLQLDVNFDAAETFDTVAQLIALDAAGNPSDPSAPFAIKFDGCTRELMSDKCAEETSELGIQGCTFGPAPLGSHVWLGLVVVSLGVAFRRITEKTNAQHHER